jgi:hypothetical protein
MPWQLILRGSYEGLAEIMVFEGSLSEFEYELCHFTSSVILCKLLHPSILLFLCRKSTNLRKLWVIRWVNAESALKNV